MNVSNRYLLADYMQDKQKANAAPATVKTPARRGQVFSSMPTVAKTVTLAPQTKATTPGAVQPASTATAAGSDAASGVVPTEEVVTKSQWTTADVDAKMQSVLQEIMDFTNRKFQYNAKESPLYTILEQQAAKEARLASGRAYSRATANTGGFDSSYAGLAAEEASRQVMEGLDDQQLAMYEAAKAEFDSQWQTRLQQYDALKTIYGDLEAKEAEKETTTNEGGLSEAASEAAQYLLNTYGVVYSENAMRQDLIGKGYSEADINAALENQRKMVGSTITDYKAGDIASALGQASALDEAYRTGQLNDEEYKAAKNDNAKIIISNVKAGMDRIDDVDYEGLGIPEEEWGTMNDSEKKLRVLDEAGRLVKKGIVSHSEYFQIVTNEVKADLNDIAEDVRGGIDKNKDRLSVAVVVQDMYDNGYLYEGAYNYLMFKTILPEMNIKELRDMYKNNETAKQMSYSQDMHDAAAVLLNHYNESETTEEKKTTNTYTGKMTWTR